MDHVTAGQPMPTPIQSLYAACTADEFPHGLRCAACYRLIEPGRLYATVPDGITRMAGFIDALVCVPCSEPDIQARLIPTPA